MDFTRRLQSSPEGQEEGNRLRARAGGVIEFRHEEGAGHNGLGQRFGATVWGNGLGQRFGATVRHNLSARPSGVWLRAVIELRHEEGGRPYIKVATRGGCRPQPESNERRKTGSQAVFRTDEYLTPGWIQPPDKPVSGFDRLPPYLYKPSTFLSVEDDVAALPW